MRILCVHQSSELYGSDRSFALCLSLIRKTHPNAILDVVLPDGGPLVDHLKGIASNIIIAPIVKLQKKDAKYLLLNKFFAGLACLPSRVKHIRKYDILYINTAVVFDYLLAARLSRRICIVHVREIPTGVAKYIFSLLLILSGGRLIFNSEATSRAYIATGALKQEVLLNGIAGFQNPTRQIFSDPTVRLLLIGRINAWKGHSLFLDAVSMLPEHLKCKLSVRIVGSAPPGEEHLERELQSRVNGFGLNTIVTCIPFSKDPAEHYYWADAVVAPSIKPEPFGLVAIEGMSAGRLVCVAEHGGLAEIIKNRINGLAFRPGSAEDLMSKLVDILEDRAGMKKIAEEGRLDFQQNYSDSAFSSRFSSVFNSLARG